MLNMNSDLKQQLKALQPKENEPLSQKISAYIIDAITVNQKNSTLILNLNQAEEMYHALSKDSSKTYAIFLNENLDCFKQILETTIQYRTDNNLNFNLIIKPQTFEDVLETEGEILKPWLETLISSPTSSITFIYSNPNDPTACTNAIEICKKLIDASQHDILISKLYAAHCDSPSQKQLASEAISSEQNHSEEKQSNELEQATEPQKKIDPHQYFYAITYKDRSGNKKIIKTFNLDQYLDNRNSIDQLPEILSQIKLDEKENDLYLSTEHQDLFQNENLLECLHPHHKYYLLFISDSTYQSIFEEKNIQTTQSFILSMRKSLRSAVVLTNSHPIEWDKKSHYLSSLLSLSGKFFKNKPFFEDYLFTKRSNDGSVTTTLNLDAYDKELHSSYRAQRKALPTGEYGKIHKLDTAFNVVQGSGSIQSQKLTYSAHDIASIQRLLEDNIENNDQPQHLNLIINDRALKSIQTDAKLNLLSKLPKGYQQISVLIVDFLEKHSLNNLDFYERLLQAEPENKPNFYFRDNENKTKKLDLAWVSHARFQWIKKQCSRKLISDNDELDDGINNSNYIIDFSKYNENHENKERHIVDCLNSLNHKQDLYLSYEMLQQESICTAVVNYLEKNKDCRLYISNSNINTMKESVNFLLENFKDIQASVLVCIHPPSIYPGQIKISDENIIYLQYIQAPSFLDYYINEVNGFNLDNYSHHYSENQLFNVQQAVNKSDSLFNCLQFLQNDKNFINYVSSKNSINKTSSDHLSDKTEPFYCYIDRDLCELIALNSNIKQLFITVLKQLNVNPIVVVIEINTFTYEGKPYSSLHQQLKEEGIALHMSSNNQYYEVGTPYEKFINKLSDDKQQQADNEEELPREAITRAAMILSSAVALSAVLFVKISTISTALVGIPALAWYSVLGCLFLLTVALRLLYRGQKQSDEPSLGTLPLDCLMALFLSAIAYYTFLLSPEVACVAMATVAVVHILMTGISLIRKDYETVLLKHKTAIFNMCIPPAVALTLLTMLAQQPTAWLALLAQLKIAPSVAWGWTMAIFVLFVVVLLLSITKIVWTLQSYRNSMKNIDKNPLLQKNSNEFSAKNSNVPLTSLQVNTIPAPNVENNHKNKLLSCLQRPRSNSNSSSS